MSALKSLVKKVTPNFLWNKLRVYKIHSDVKNFRNEVVEHNYSGVNLKVHIEDPLGKGWYDQDWPFIHEIEFFKEKGILREGAKVFDLGAHQAVLAMILADAVGNSGKVLAVEANKHNFQVANKNKDINNYKQLEVVHAAVSEQEGEIEFNEGLNGAIVDEKGEWGRVKVPGRTLNNLVESYFEPNIIFLDIEGYECLLMKSAKDLLSKNINWFIEMHGDKSMGAFGGSPEDVLSQFSEQDFDMYMAKDGDQFKKFDKSDSMIHERFFFIALKK